MVLVRTRFFNLRIPAGGNATAPRELVVEDGRLAAVTPAGQETASEGEQWVDLGGRLVLPGAIDGHVHFDDPGFTHREDFSTGTMAAAAGGVTCVVDMPCTSLPPVTDTLAFANKLLAITPKAHVDYMLWGGVSANALERPDWRDRLAELAAAGIAAVKVYLLSGMESFRHLSVAQLRDVLVETRRLDLPVGVHAEDADTVREEESLLRRRGLDSPRAYADSRPPVAEVRAVEHLIDACRQTGARAHVVHLASGDALDRISAARREGCPITAETCPHFLEFTVEDLESMGALLKTAPVVKSAADRARLWQGLAESELAFVATDHAAGQWPDEKRTGSIWTDYGGIPGVELLLPYLLLGGSPAGSAVAGAPGPGAVVGAGALLWHRPPQGGAQARPRRRLRRPRRERDVDGPRGWPPQSQPLHALRGPAPHRPGARDVPARDLCVRAAGRRGGVVRAGRHGRVRPAWHGMRIRA